MRIVTKVSLLVAAVLLSGIEGVQAQRGLAGQVGIGVSAGMVDGFVVRDAQRGLRYCLTLETVRWNRNHTCWRITAGYLLKDYFYVSAHTRQRVPVRQYTFTGGYGISLLSDWRRNISLRGNLAAVLGYETVNDGHKLLDDGSRLLSRDTFLVGPQVSLTVEAYLSNRVMACLEVAERWLPSSATGPFHTTVSVGIRFIIN